MVQINLIILYILVAFILPWLLGIYLFLKYPKLVLTITPFAVAVSHVFNTLGVYFDYWKLKPLDSEGLDYMIFNTGIFSILPLIMIVLIIKFKDINAYIIILLFNVFATLLEYIPVKLDYVIYMNGWNIYYTYLSYLAAYLIVFWYYRLLIKYEVLHRLRFI